MRSWNNAVLASENVEITRNEKDRRSEIDLESLKKVAAVSISDQCVLIQLFDVSFETSFHFLAIGIAVVIGTDVAMDIVSRSRPRGVLTNRSITSLPFSDNCVNQFFLPPPSPLPLSLFTARNSISQHRRYNQITNNASTIIFRTVSVHLATKQKFYQ